jgi:predicted RNA-binding protein with PUA-like domain
MAPVAFWLMKSEPDVFSIEDLRRQAVAGWDGVRNYQARNFMRQMRCGEQALFYHSNAKPSAVAGLMEIAREAYTDPTQFNAKSPYFDPDSDPATPRWVQVDVRFLRAFQRPLSLEAIRRIPTLADLLLLRRSRLSIQPLTAGQWDLLQPYLA